MTRLPRMHAPPRAVRWLLHRCTHLRRHDERCADLEELFYERARHLGVRRARMRYVLDVAGIVLRPALYRKHANSAGVRSSLMLKNYVKTAIRHLLRRRGYAFINVLGLATGLACCLCIGLYVFHERSYDTFHANAGRTYRLIFAWDRQHRTEPPPIDQFSSYGPAAIGPAMVQAFPEVEKAVRFSGGHTILLAHGARQFQEERYFFADAEVFDVFSFPLLEGDPETALVQPNTIVLSASAAQKYFGDADPMGQPMRLDDNQELTVTGVMADLPSNTHFDFDMLLSMPTFERTAPDYMFQNWGYVDFYTYVLLAGSDRRDDVATALPSFVARNATGQTDDKRLLVALEPVTDAYLSPVGGARQIGPKGDPANLTLFALAGMFILLIACVNFMNLSTARSMERAKEVGVRKVMGSRRGALVRQFLTEAVVMALVAMVLALVLAAAALPVLQRFSSGAFTLQALLRPQTLGLLLGVTVLTGLAAGSYPALVLSRYGAVAVLKGAFTRSRTGTAMRRGLVTLQFAVSAILLAGTLGVYHQLHYMRSQELGFAEDQQLVLDFGSDAEVLGHLQAVKQRLAALPAVRSVTATQSIPGRTNPQATTQVQAPDGTMVERAIDVYLVDTDFVDQMGLDVLAGRSYSDAFPTDTSQALVINEAAAHRYGYSNPADAVGKPFTQWGRQGQIIGVVADFHFHSLRERVAPLALRLSPNGARYLIVKVDTRQLPETLAALEGRWKSIAPHRPFLYSFLDATFDAQYRADERFGRLFTAFAGLALFVACLGLFGMAAFTIQQRTKEIGVRKVLGARVLSIAGLLLRDVVILVAMALLIGFPMAYLGLRAWLQHYAYHAPPSPLLFVVAALIVLATALLAVGVQTARAALADPVKSLRYE